MRSAGGSNYHPSAPTFLQLYKLLSLFGVVKPPQKGNCIVNADHSRLVGLAEFKDLFSTKRGISLQQALKEKLNEIIDNDECDYDVYADFLEASVPQCIAYYITGELFFCI